MNRGRALLGALAGALLAADLALGPASAAAAAPVDLLTLEGVISPVTLRLVETGLTRARSDGAQALILQLDTPGGLERSMRAIAQRMLNAEVPVIVYVAPTGARAASAGVFITMAAHVARSEERRGGKESERQGRRRRA